MSKKPHNYKKRNQCSPAYQEKLEKDRVQRLKARIVDGEIVADDFFDKSWFKTLQKEILTEIRRLGSCTIGDLVRGKFAETDRYHFAEALQSIEEKLIRQDGLITRYRAK